MAGRPKMRSDMHILNNIVPSAAAEIFDNIADGKPIWKCADLFGVSKRALTEWLEDPARIESYKRARVRSSTTFAERGLQVARGPKRAPEDTEDSAVRVARDKLHVYQLNRLASAYNPELYGEQRGPQVTINLATLHLDALRQRNSERTQQQGVQHVQSSHDLPAITVEPQP